MDQLGANLNPTMSTFFARGNQYPGKNLTTFDRALTNCLYIFPTLTKDNDKLTSSTNNQPMKLPARSQADTSISTWKIRNYN